MFTEYEKEGWTLLCYKATSPFGRIYIDHNLVENTFSYSIMPRLGDDVSLIEAIKAVNVFHDRKLKTLLR